MLGFDLTVPLGPVLLILSGRQIFKILFGISPRWYLVRMILSPASKAALVQTGYL